MSMYLPEQAIDDLDQYSPAFLQKSAIFAQ